MTRSTDFNDVSFFASTIDPSELNEENLHRCIRNHKIKNYELQDAKRKIEDDKYVDHDWFIKRINGNCQNCGCRFEFDVKNGCLTNSHDRAEVKQRDPAIYAELRKRGANCATVVQNINQKYLIFLILFSFYIQLRKTFCLCFSQMLQWSAYSIRCDLQRTPRLYDLSSLDLVCASLYNSFCDLRL